MYVKRYIEQQQSNSSYNALDCEVNDCFVTLDILVWEEDEVFDCLFFDCEGDWIATLYEIYKMSAVVIVCCGDIVVSFASIFEFLKKLVETVEDTISTTRPNNYANIMSSHNKYA